MWDIETIFFLVVLTPIIVVVLLHFIAAIRRGLAENSRQTSWRNASGEIEAAALQHNFDGDPFVSVRYKFHIDDQPYWGTQKIRVNASFSRRDVRDLCPIGQEVTIVYDPDDPEIQSRLSEYDRGRIASHRGS